MFPDKMLSKAFKVLSLVAPPTPTPLSSTRPPIDQPRARQGADVGLVAFVEAPEL